MEKSSQGLGFVGRHVMVAVLVTAWSTVCEAQLHQIDYPVGRRPGAVATGLFRSGSTFLDLAVANGGSNTVSILLGNGDGTFTPGQVIPVGVDPRAIAVGDFNHDGKPDLVVANRGSNTLTLLLGRGDGTFTVSCTIGLSIVAEAHKDVLESAVACDVSSYSSKEARGPASPRPVALAVGDFNGDSFDDFAVVNSGTNTVSIFLGRADGGFQRAPDVAVGAAPSALAIGLFRSSGNQDLAVTNLGGNTVSILLGRGDGTFEPQRTVGVGNAPSAIAIGEFRTPGLRDLAVTNRDSDSLSVLNGNGDGTFTRRNPDLALPPGAMPVSVVVGDFDRNGRLHVITINQGTHNATSFFVHLDGSFSPGLSIGSYCRPTAGTIGDFNPAHTRALVVTGLVPEACRTGGDDGEVSILDDEDCLPPWEIDGHSVRSGGV